MVWAAEAPTLTLPQVIALALKYSPEIKVSKSEVEVAQQQHAQARSHLYPQVETLVSTGIVPNARRPVIVNNAIVYPDPTGSTHGVNIFGRLDLTAIQPIYTFGKISLRKDAAERNVKIKQDQVEGKKGDVIVQVAQAYYGLILADTGKDAVKEARTYLADAKDRVDRLLQVGSTSVRESDRYRLAMFEGAVEKFAAEAEEGAKVAYQALKALIGYGPNQDIKVPLELPQPAAASSSLEHYIRKALDLRPEFAQLEGGMAARKLLLEAAKADRYPSFFVALKGGLAGAPGRDYLRDPYIQDYFNERSLGAFLGMHWQLDFGISKAKIGEAQAELSKVKHLHETALMGIPVEVAQAYGKVQENYKKTLGLEKSYTNARRWLITAFSDFDMGLGKMEDIFRAFESYGQYRGDYLMTLYNYHLADVQLAKATGLYRVQIPGEKDKPR
jgi:outer membrane protein TolC